MRSLKLGESSYVFVVITHKWCQEESSAQMW